MRPQQTPKQSKITIRLNTRPQPSRAIQDYRVRSAEKEAAAALPGQAIQDYRKAEEEAAVAVPDYREDDDKAAVTTP